MSVAGLGMRGIGAVSLVTVDNGTSQVQSKSWKSMGKARKGSVRN